MASPTIIACHGLAIGWPVDQLAAWLQAQTRLTVQVVGGLDPQPLDPAIRAVVANAQQKGPVIFIGHSKGAMLAFYVSDQFDPALTIAIDPTDWGSNINTPPWSLVTLHPGKWQATGKNRVICIHSNNAPGGGSLINVDAPLREDHLITGADHLSVVNDPRSLRVIVNAVKAVS